MECIVVVDGICFSLTQALIIGGILLGILFVALMWVVDIVRKNMAGQEVVTDATQSTPEDNHPYQVGTHVYAGKTDSGHEVFLKIDRYDDEEMVVYCTALIEIPTMATNIMVDHEDTSEYALGMISVHFELEGEAVEQKVYLTNETLEASDWSVAVNVARSSKIDLSGVK